MAFASPVHNRLILAGALAVAGWAGVWLVEGRRAPPLPVAAPAALTGTRTIAIKLTASTPIAAWTISQLGTPVSGTGDATTWRGTATVPITACDLLIEATPVATDPAWALRLVANGPGLRSDRTAWAPGTQVELLVLPAAKP